MRRRVEVQCVVVMKVLLAVHTIFWIIFPNIYYFVNIKLSDTKICCNRRMYK